MLISKHNNIYQKCRNVDFADTLIKVQSKYSSVTRQQHFQYEPLPKTIDILFVKSSCEMIPLPFPSFIRLQLNHLNPNLVLNGAKGMLFQFEIYNVITAPQSLTGVSTLGNKSDVMPWNSCRSCEVSFATFISFMDNRRTCHAI